jgi:uncharacterized protein
LNPAPAELLENESKVQLLILSDGKPGHLNQSLAFARLLGCSYLVCPVEFRCRIYKLLSYLLDRLGIYSRKLFQLTGQMPQARIVVSAGSDTYYANRVIAGMLSARSVALMWPGGYRPDFDLILAQQHDHPPKLDNLIEIPVNLSAPRPEGLVAKEALAAPCIAVIIGGPSKHYRLVVKKLELQLQQIFQLFPAGDFLVTTSRRTPAEVETLLEGLPFRYRLLYSQCRDNPVADFLDQADHVFITEDSTSMISEAVCWGKGTVEILPLESVGRKNKVQQMTDRLSANGFLHRFDGSLGQRNAKIDLNQLLVSVVPQAWLA